MYQTSPGIKIGILGGGQLARMLVLEGHRFGFEMHVLSENQSDPAAQVTRHWSQGQLSSGESVTSFVRKMDVTTFESEFLNSNVFGDVSNAKIFPHPQTMAVLQDRLTQKQLLLENKVPTLEFAEVSNLTEVKKFLAHNRSGIVLKTRRNGYDGYGTFIVRNEHDIEKLASKWAADWPALIAEPLCSFQRELAVSFARNVDGDIVELPFVETEQRMARCFSVKGPILKPTFNKLSRQLRRFIEEIDYVGVIAFELFETRKEIFVNEIAPRVHNSAHYSLDALSISQFGLHLLAINNLHLPKVELLAKGFAMVNLLGKSHQLPQLTNKAGSKLHWYGKAENRPDRKMGHINSLAKNPDSALKSALKAANQLKL